MSICSSAWCFPLLVLQEDSGIKIILTNLIDACNCDIPYPTLRRGLLLSLNVGKVYMRQLSHLAHWPELSPPAFVYNSTIGEKARLKDNKLSNEIFYYHFQWQPNRDQTRHPKVKTKILLSGVRH